MKLVRSTKKSPARRARGFTLVELMVAVVGGLFVSVAVFTVAKQTTRFAMRQVRIADTMMQTVVGFERLKADIARAGFLGTPDITGDESFCGVKFPPGYPAFLQELASVRIEDNPTLTTEQTVNGLAPRRITISGSPVEDDFEAVNVPRLSVAPTIRLKPDSLGMTNLGYPGNPVASVLTPVFRAGRALRIKDDRGRIQFGVISSVTGGANPAITLEALPALQFRGAGGSRCGVAAHGTGTLVNVVNAVRYELESLRSDAKFNAIYGRLDGTRTGPPSESSRLELVRKELDMTGAVMAGSTELVAEYAVDLDFSLVVERNVGGALAAVHGADVDDYAGAPASRAGPGPQRIRAVRAWLSTRTREADRTAPLSLATAPQGSGPSLMRISLDPTDRNNPPFARLRTLQAVIPLINQEKATW